ncbi:MAG: hypothetical protein ACYDH4_10030 [Candidatus Cryosericum sp.]
MKTSRLRSCSTTVLFTGVLVVVALVAGCTSAQNQLPTRDQLLARIMSADNYSVEFVRGEIGAVTGDIGILTTSTGYLTPLTRSQLAGSIAGRFETLANIGITMRPLNEKELGFDALDSKEIQAARLTTDVCADCSQKPHGPIGSVQDIARRISKEGTLTPQDSSYLQGLSVNLKKASCLIGQYITENDSTVRTTIAEQVTELCTQLRNQE